MTSPPLRVLFVNHTAELGGGEIALLELIRNLDRSRIEPIVVLFSDGPLAPLLREEVQVHILLLSHDVLKANKDRLGIKTFLRGGPVLAGLSFLYHLRHLVRSIRPGILYTNSLKADVLGGIAGRLAGIPVVWHVRDRISPDYLPRKAVTLFRYLAKIIPNYIVANSVSTLSSLDPRQPLPVNSQAARVIHDGVNVSKYSQTHVLTESDSLTIGLIGRISPWKGQDVFIEAIRLISKSHPTVRFEIIGSPTFGEVEFASSVQRLLQTYNLCDIIKLTGFEPDIPGRLKTLDIVVHASTIPEPFGQVIIEGMAAGKPVVATNGGGVPEIVVDGVTGILVPMKDPYSLAQAMHTLLIDRSLRARMGLAGRQHVASNFTMRKTAAAVEDLLLVHS